MMELIECLLSFLSRALLLYIKPLDKMGNFIFLFLQSAKLLIVLFLFPVTYVVRMAVAHVVCSLVVNACTSNPCELRLHTTLHAPFHAVFVQLWFSVVSVRGCLQCFHLRYQALDVRTAKLLSKSFGCEGQPKRRELPEMQRSSNGLIHIEDEHRACTKAQ